MLQVCDSLDEATPPLAGTRYLHQAAGRGEGEKRQLRPGGVCSRAGRHRSGRGDQGHAEDAGEPP